MKLRTRPLGKGFQSFPAAASMSPSTAATVTRFASAIAMLCPPFATALTLRGASKSTAVFGTLLNGMSTSTRPEISFTTCVTVCTADPGASCSFTERPSSMRAPGARRSTAPPASCLVVPSAVLAESVVAGVFASEACSVFENKLGSATNNARAGRLAFILRLTDESAGRSASIVRNSPRCFAHVRSRASHCGAAAPRSFNASGERAVAARRVPPGCHPARSHRDAASRCAASGLARPAARAGEQCRGFRQLALQALVEGQIRSPTFCSTAAAPVRGRTSPRHSAASWTGDRDRSYAGDGSWPLLSRT